MGLFLRTSTRLLCFAGFIGNLIAAPSDPTALRLIDLHLQARGGKTAIESLESLTRQADEREGHREFVLEWTWARDLGVREDRHRYLRGRDFHRLRVRDGSMVWGHDLSPERSRPGLLGSTEASEFLWKSILCVDPCRPFLDGPEFGYQFTYLGERTVKKRPAYLVRMNHKDTPEVEYAFDAKTFLLLRLRFVTSFAGKETQSVVYPIGAERLGGVLFETGFDFFVEGKRFRQIRFDNSRVNIPVTPDFFQKPYVHPRTFGK